MSIFFDQLTYKRHLRIVVGLSLITATVSSCLAELILQPPALSPGDQYRLIFTTSETHDALSTEIQDYNNFVQSVADSAPELAEWDLDWTALMWLPPDVTAMDNTNTQPEIENIPIYRVDGKEFVKNYEGLWGPEAVSTLIDLGINEFGERIPADPRKYENGEIQVHVGGILNSDGSRTTGIANGNGSQLISGGGLRALNAAHFYAISEVVTAVPEPSSGFLGLCAMVVIAFSRRRTTLFHDAMHS